MNSVVLPTTDLFGDPPTRPVGQRPREAWAIAKFSAVHDQLWDGPAWVLPISFGPILDQTDAMLGLFLDDFRQARLGLIPEIALRSRARALAEVDQAA